MSASIPPDGERARSLRPWFLVAVMVVLWLYAVKGVTVGWTTIDYLRGGRVPDVAAAVAEAQAKEEPIQGLGDVSTAVQLKALSDHRQTTFPLSVARILLSLLLIVGSAMAISGRPGARWFTLQVLMANVALTIVEYAVSHDLRAQIILEASAAASAIPFPPESERVTALVRSPAALYWIHRFSLALELGLLGVGVLTMWTRRTQAFFEATARADEQRQREDEP